MKTLESSMAAMEGVAKKHRRRARRPSPFAGLDKLFSDQRSRIRKKLNKEERTRREAKRLTGAECDIVKDRDVVDIKRRS